VLTERLRIRPLQIEDLEDLYEIWGDPRVERWIGPHSREAVRVELGFHVAHQAEHGWSLWALEALDTGRFVGDCGLQPLALVGPETELGYDLHPEVWGQGLATEAARAVVRLAFDRLAIDRLVAAVKPQHGASRRVLEKVGLTPAGEREVYGEPMLLYEALSSPGAPPGEERRSPRPAPAAE
jgi:RimJ/RimL family protein N-acetyltransferase